MADACIVCLGDLRTIYIEDTATEEVATALSDDSKGQSAKTATSYNAKSIDSDDEAIAHLLPCKHDLHNSCLKPWVERANSCPICRTIFNMVEISRTVGGPAVDSYPVKDKLQEAEIDPSLVVEDELFAVDTFDPCVVCGVLDDGHGSMYCDGCDRSVHIFCAGFDDAPDVWYCDSCLVDLENDIDLPGLASAAQRRPRQRNTNGGRAGPRRRRNNDQVWARVWQEVSRRLDLDLDFPFDDETEDPQQIAENRREIQRWQARFDVASRVGATNRLRGIAQANLHNTNLPLPPPDPESQEEIRAWNAFDKARETDDAPTEVRRRKRRATQSPASPAEPQTEAQQPQLKRPRLHVRRPPNTTEIGESSTAAVRRNADNPTFLSSLLHEVETKPAAASSPATSDQVYEQYSPRGSSPVHSPHSSEPGTPKATTPPHRPLSPPLSSHILPATSPLAATFSPFSPTTTRDDSAWPIGHARGRRRRELDERVGNDEGSDDHRASSHSPSRGLSYPAKEEIQRMVKLALGSRYRDKEITKDQYTDINRDVSRKLYEKVPNATALADQPERERLQTFANDEVAKAVAILAAAESMSDGRASD